MCPHSQQHEAAWLAALRECDTADPDSELAFDDLTRLTAAICETPAAVVCLMDGRRIWSNSVIGDVARAAERADCLCRYALNSPGPLVVPDTTSRAPFSELPMVAGPPYFRAFAGVPIALQGKCAVGLIYVADTRPRTFTPSQIDALHVLAQQAAALLDLRHRAQIQAKLEQELRASEQRYRGVIESQAEMITRFLGDGTLTFVNEAYCRYFRVPRERLIGHNLFDWIPQDHRASVRDMIAALPASGEPVYIENLVLHPDGAQAWTRWANRAISDPQGRIIEYQSFGWDVTDRKNAEIALAASEQKFREIVENLSEMVCRYLPDTTLTFVNKAYCARMGASAEELIGRKFLDYLPASEHERLLQHIAQLPRTGEPAQYEHMGPMPGGKIGWQRWTDRAILDEAGNVVEFQGFGWDVTDRKLAEIAMRESASKFRTVAEHSPFGLFITDASGGCLYTNPAYERISGQKTAESLGAGWVKAVHPEDLERIRSGWEQAVRERREFSGDKRYLHPDGKVIYGVVRAAPFFKEGEIEGYVGTVKDCTDFYLTRASLESANAELSRTNRKLEERHRELIQLAYAMTHDLQTPVATIGAAVASLENALGENVTPTIAANLARGRRAAARLTDTLDSLMVYALSGGESLEFAPVDIGQALRELVREHFSAVAAGDGQRVSLEHQIVDATVLAHRPAVDRCLQNLLHNAVKFTSASRADGRITVRSVVDSANVRVCIEDNGPGIPPDLLEQVFLPFKRGPHGGSGTGLGLSIVRRYAEAFRGRAWLESDGRSGTRAFLELPLAPIDAEPHANRAVLIADPTASRATN